MCGEVRVTEIYRTPRIRPMARGEYGEISTQADDQRLRTRDEAVVAASELRDPSFSA
jgi:hypothetical protein